MTTTDELSRTAVPDLVDSYARDGFAIIPDAVSPADVAAILADATRVCRGEHGAIHGADDRDPALSVDEVLSQFLAIHMPHKISPVMREALTLPPIVGAVTSLVGPNVKSMQSMLFIKPPGMPGQAWHQDEYFIPTRDRSLTAAWIALDDAGIDNGCLWAIPGSHTSGVIWPLEAHDDPRFDRTPEAKHFPFDEADAVPLEARSGSVVIFSGHLLHRSLPNRTRGSYRRSLVNHYMRAESLLPWHASPCGAAFGHDHRDIVMVAGDDPYAFKGLQDIAEPHVRLR